MKPIKENGDGLGADEMNMQELVNYTKWSHTCFIIFCLMTRAMVLINYRLSSTVKDHEVLLPGLPINQPQFSFMTALQCWLGITSQGRSEILSTSKSAIISCKLSEFQALYTNS